MTFCSAVLREMLAVLRRRWRALLLYHLFFTILLTSLLLPASSLVLQALLRRTGEPAVTNLDIVTFLLSPTGLAWLLLAATLTLGWIFLDQAGMIVIAARGSAGRYRAAMAALWHVGLRLPRLLALTGIRVLGHLALSLPLVLLFAGLWARWLGDFELYFLVAERPPVVWWFLATVSPLIVLFVIGNGLLYGQWVLAVPIVLLEGPSILVALRRSARLAGQHRWQVLGAVLPVAAGVLLLPVLATLVIDWTVVPLLGLLPEWPPLLIGATIAVLMLAILLAVAATFLGIGANGLVVHAVYRRLTARREPMVEPPPSEGSVIAVWGVELVVLGFALAQALHVLAGFDLADDVAITAHRGSSLAAPENTLAAIVQAVADGADFVEVDVRAAADGVPVLLHDRDLLRVAGIDRRVWELRAEELGSIDVGSWLDPAFAGEGVPTLAQAIAAVGDAAGLYIEIKPALDTPALVARVIEELRAAGVVAGTIVASLNRAVLDEVHALEPGLRRARIVHSSIGLLDPGGSDALSLRAAVATPDLVVTAHRQGYELHVWTVNDTAAMSRLIDLGVDNIITDRPAALARLLEERAALGRGERLVLKLHNWLRR